MIDGADIDALNAWLAKAGLRGEPEAALVSGFCERAVAAGLPISRAQLFIDTLHPVCTKAAWSVGGMTRRNLSCTNTAAPARRKRPRISISRLDLNRAALSHAGAPVHFSACCRPGRACYVAASPRKAQPSFLSYAITRRRA